MNLAQVSADDFRPHLGRTFFLSEGEGPKVEGLLLEANETGTDSGGEPHRVPFSLLFRVATGALPLQGIFRLTHDDLTLDLLMTKVAPDDQGDRYEAVFN